MPKYLMRARYTPEGLRGLKEDSGTRRKESVTKALSSVGGKLEAMYFAFGEDDVILIADLPDNTAMAAVALGVGATGTVSIDTVPLLTLEEIDKALKQKIDFRPAGR